MGKVKEYYQEQIDTEKEVLLLKIAVEELKAELWEWAKLVGQLDSALEDNVSINSTMRKLTRKALEVEKERNQL